MRAYAGLPAKKPAPRRFRIKTIPTVTFFVWVLFMASYKSNPYATRGGGSNAGIAPEK
jgi:hypothetical protein